MDEINMAIAKEQGAVGSTFSNGMMQGPSAEDAAMMHLLEEQMPSSLPPPTNTKDDDNNSDDGDPLPQEPLSDADVQEARAIVMKAQQEAAERDKMKEKAKTASRDDLQAMINARMMRK